MTSQVRSLKIPVDLAEAAEVRARELGYPSWGAFVKGLMRYDLMVLKPHSTTVEISKMPHAKQDAVDARLLQNLKEGKSEKGSYLERLLEKVKDPAKIAQALVDGEE